MKIDINSLLKYLTANKIVKKLQLQRFTLFVNYSHKKCVFLTLDNAKLDSNITCCMLQKYIIMIFCFVYVVLIVSKQFLAEYRKASHEI